LLFICNEIRHNRVDDTDTEFLSFFSCIQNYLLFRLLDRVRNLYLLCRFSIRYGFLNSITLSATKNIMRIILIDVCEGIRWRSRTFCFSFHSLIQPFQDKVRLFLEIFLYDHFLLQHVTVLCIHYLIYIFISHTFSSFFF